LLPDKIFPFFKNIFGILINYPYICGNKIKDMLKNFKTSEILILVMTIVIIFVSEYYYLVQNDVSKAIFIGLWPPTILGLLNYVNSKTKK
jgi:hypothetical protein